MNGAVMVAGMAGSCATGLHFKEGVKKYIAGSHVTRCSNPFVSCCLRIKFDQMPQLLKLRKGEFQQLGPHSVQRSVSEPVALGWVHVVAALGE